MQRLRRKTDLDRVFQEGRRFHSPWAILLARPRGPEQGLLPGPRLGVVAGRGFPSAVARNQARRRLRETCRVLLAGVQCSWDLLVIARPEMLQARYPERVRVLSGLLKDAGVLGEKAATAR